MKKLKNKVFYVILLILTIFLISILIIFNSQNYRQEANNIKENLMRMDGNRNRQNNRPPNQEQIEDKIKEPGIFMDSTIYTVILDENFNVIDVINHSTNDVSDEEIKTIAEKIVEENTITNLEVGNLYFDKYSYSFIRNTNTLVIIDNSNAQEKLMQILKTSILTFVILEIAIIIVSKKLTNWIIKPVEESFDKQKQFIADASHELKTPLAVIIASSEALENEPEEKKWLLNIKNESERMNNLISELLNLAKSENEVKEQHINENLSKIVERTILTFESLIYEKNIKLDYKINDNIFFSCNGNQIKEVIGILLDNAIKHSPLKGEIKVNLKKEKGNIVLTVTNKGDEIPKEEQEKIFERFYRADKSRNRNENRYGLGLAIAKNIATNHNGKISVNCENGYTTFKIVFK